MCHYAQLTFPVPAVNVDTLNPPLGAAVDPVSPAPIVIVLVSGYFNIIIPEPPALPPLFPVGPYGEPPLPPPPVKSVPAVDA
jgi:hypothetical protein